MLDSTNYTALAVASDPCATTNFADARVNIFVVTSEQDDAERRFACATDIAAMHVEGRGFVDRRG